MPPNSCPHTVLAYVQPIRGTRMRFGKWERRRSYRPSGQLWAEVWADAGMRLVAVSGWNP